ncbi:tetratricopeptide repeat protein [Bdellovibrio bacteriovorus]|uniref:tetratricopeptide repeat protein n=1 Tax=Bdellovibrio bacteriovorus TaxID=959 RepID=UPI003A807C4F
MLPMVLNSTNSTKYLNRSFGRIPSLLLGILSFLLIAIAQIKSPFVQGERKDFIAPLPMMERFSFGYSETLADLMWVRALQDFDYCDQSVGENICRNNSWLYQMLDTITNLSPQFRIPYAAGALALTVIITDVDGATKIFDKGVRAFPNDWPILYRAAYHYMYEVKDNKRAAELLIQAAKNGAPPWVFNLAGRLYSDAGNLELAESVLQDMINTKQDPGLVKRLQGKIQSMKNK